MKLERIKAGWQRLKTTGKSGIIISFISGFLIAMFEESIEEMIAWGISVVVTKAISVVFVVTITQTITQTIKVAIKKLIKLITYKKGADKMDKVKLFFKKLIDWFRANPLTIGASVANLASSSGFGATIYAVFTYFNVAIPDWALYLIVAVSSVLVACLAEWGILKEGWETIDEKTARCNARAEAKAAKEEAKRIEKEAKAALDAEAAEVARIEADAKAVLEAEAKAKADAEKAVADAKAEAEHKARVDAKIAELRNQK